MATIASDTFTRTVASGWGTADQGGAWTTAGSPSGLSVADGVGNISLPRVASGGGGGMRLASVSVRDLQQEFTYTMTGAANIGTRYIGMKARVSGSSDFELDAKHSLDGSVALSLWRDGGAAELLIIPGLLTSWAAGQAVRLKMEVSGTTTTTVKGKVWRDGTAEPGWQLTHSLTTSGALGGAGAVGIELYRNSDGTTAASTLKFDNYLVTDLSTPAPSTYPKMYVGTNLVTAAYRGTQPTTHI